LLLALAAAEPARSQSPKAVQLQVRLAPDSAGSGARAPIVRSQHLLDDGRWLSALRSGLPVRLHYRVEVWRSREGWFDTFEREAEWDVVVHHEPLLDQYTLLTIVGARARERRYATLDALSAALAGRISVVTGPSGAGKSTLLNRVQPGLRLRIGEISAKGRRGKNTTVSAVMLPLDGGGYLVDTPGFSEVGLWGIDPKQLDSCFPDFRPYLGECRYADCRHRSEPGCRIHVAVAEGAIGADRLVSYLVLLEELEMAPEEWE